MLIKEWTPLSWPQSALPGLSKQQPRALGKGEAASIFLAKWPSSLETLAQLNGDTWCLLLQLQEQYNKDQAESQAPHKNCFLTKITSSSSHSHQSFFPSQIVYPLSSVFSIFLPFKTCRKRQLQGNPNLWVTRKEEKSFPGCFILSGIKSEC